MEPVKFAAWGSPSASAMQQLEELRAHLRAFECLPVLTTTTNSSTSTSVAAEKQKKREITVVGQMDAARVVAAMASLASSAILRHAELLRSWRAFLAASELASAEDWADERATESLAEQLYRHAAATTTTNTTPTTFAEEVPKARGEGREGENQLSNTTISMTSCSTIPQATTSSPPPPPPSYPKGTSRTNNFARVLPTTTTTTLPLPIPRSPPQARDPDQPIKPPPPPLHVSGTAPTSGGEVRRRLPTSLNARGQGSALPHGHGYSKRMSPRSMVKFLSTKSRQNTTTTRLPRHHDHDHDHDHTDLPTGAKTAVSGASSSTSSITMTSVFSSPPSPSVRVSRRLRDIFSSVPVRLGTVLEAKRASSLEAKYPEGHLLHVDDSPERRLWTLLAVAVYSAEHLREKGFPLLPWKAYCEQRVAQVYLGTPESRRLCPTSSSSPSPHCLGGDNGVDDLIVEEITL